MTLPIKVRKRTYHHYKTMVPGPGQPPFPGKAEKRSFLSPNKQRIRLRQTCGTYADIGGRNILFVIDQDAGLPGSDQWRFIHDIAQRLVDAFPKLNQAARDALAALHAVVFTKSPDRSFANVGNGCFFYDTDEFKVGDSGRISTAYAASNIVHDANHVLLSRQGKQTVGDAAEVACWQLQVDNQAALGLLPHEVNFLKGFIADPASARQRMNQDPF